MGMTNEQFKAYIQGLLEDIKEIEELRESSSPELQNFGDKKMKTLQKKLQEALER